jgi:hypothetical protein
MSDVELPRLIFKPISYYSRFSVGALYSKMTSDPFKGEIDEINIWNMALSSDKINYLMNQEIEQ